MCADENSSDKKTYQHSPEWNGEWDENFRHPTEGHTGFVSSRGVEFVTDESREKDILRALTGFTCGFCQYPIMASWRFCPNCGGLLEWKALTG